MKKISLIAVALASLLVSYSTLHAQKLTKKELKTWKKKLRQTTPQQFKTLTEKINSLQRERNALVSQAKTFDREKAELQTQIDEKATQIAKLEQKIRTLEEESAVSHTGADSEDWSTGVVYKVQVGAFRNKDLSQYQAQGNFWMEDNDGTKKYTIARFRNYEEATLFKDYMREMGVQDAWIVAYEDNLRKDITDVLPAEGDN